MSFNMSFNEEQIALQKMLRKFVDNEMIPVRALYDETEEYPWPVVKKNARIGAELYSST
jgi:Acyl-CoA dehydrogenase, N-terminal domain.